MSVKNIGTNRWRVTAKTGYDPETGKPLYFDSTIKGTHEEAKQLEAEHTLFDKRMFSDLTIDSYAKTKWLPAITEEVAGNTYDFYAGTLRRHVLPYIGGIALRDFGIAECKAYFLQLEDSKRTVARKTLSAMLSYAAEDGLIPVNPVSLLTKRTKTSRGSRRRRRPYRVFSENEQLVLLEALKGTCIESVCLVMLNGGARREEGCGLDWEMFDWNAMTAPVERAYIVRSGSGKCEMGDPKNDPSWRDLLFSGYAADRLYELSIGQSGPICKSSDGKRMRPDVINDLFKALCKLYGLPDINVGHLRHTFATNHIKAGTDLATLRDLMGHSSVSTIIDRYLLPLAEDQRRAQDSVAEKLDPRTVGRIA